MSKVQNKYLTAKVKFHDVDGNLIERTYDKYSDIEWALSSLGEKITDIHNFDEVKNETYSGLNGIIDITKPVDIMICME